MCALPIVWERPPIGLGRLISSAMADRGGGVFLRTVLQERLIDCRGADLDKRSQRSPLPFPLVPGSAGTRLTRHLLYPAYILVAWKRLAMLERVSAFLMYPAPVNWCARKST